jgi:hypothetical protein
MKKNKDFQSLTRIKKVEAPPFLFTRIEQRVKNLRPDKISLRWVLGGSLSFCLLLYFNITLINLNLNNEVSTNDLELVLDDMNMNASNQLYYE